MSNVSGAVRYSFSLHRSAFSTPTAAAQSGMKNGFECSEVGMCVAISRLLVKCSLMVLIKAVMRCNEKMIWSSRKLEIITINLLGLWRWFHLVSHEFMKIPFLTDLTPLNASQVNCTLFASFIIPACSHTKTTSVLLKHFRPLSFSLLVSLSRFSLTTLETALSLSLQDEN
jgi:hypothetical protein